MIPLVRVPSADYMTKLHWRLRARLPMWVIYRPGAREYPQHWAARMHITLPETRPTRFVITHDSLEELRSLLPPGLTLMQRDPLDVPQIEEVWL